MYIHVYIYVYIFQTGPVSSHYLWPIQDLTRSVAIAHRLGCPYTPTTSVLTPRLRQIQDCALPWLEVRPARNLIACTLRSRCHTTETRMCAGASSKTGIFCKMLKLLMG